MARMLPLIVLLALGGSMPLFGQQRTTPGAVPKQVMVLESQGRVFPALSPFRGLMPAEGLSLPEEVLPTARILAPDAKVIRETALGRPELLEILLPSPEGEPLRLRVYRVRPGGDGFHIRWSDGRVDHDPEGALYRGMVVGESNSLVAISFFPDHVRGFIATEEGTLTLGPLEGQTVPGLHILYDDLSLAEHAPTGCSMLDLPGRPKSPKGEGSRGSANDCVNIYWEVDHDIFQNKGNSTGNWMIGLTNEVYTLYANDGMTLETSLIFVWVTPSPYTGPSDGLFLEQFRDHLDGNFTGDLAHLVNFQGSGGVAYLDGLCFPPYNVAYSRVSSIYANVPVYSWSVNVCTHEIGHNIGSPHTHDCFWNGNDTRIDNCGGNAGFPAGNCNSNPPNPTNGGTIMSYCHLLPSVGINFNNGFGPQPTELLQQRIADAACLIGCGGANICTFIITCPPHVTVECGSDLDPVTSGMPTVQITGNCENDPVTTWTDDDSAVTGCNETGTLLRTFIATEGIYSTGCTQVITIVDTTDPVIQSIGPDVTISCTEDLPLPEEISYDYCGEVTMEITEELLPGSCASNYLVRRTYVASDACNNTASDIQMITVRDVQAPAFNPTSPDTVQFLCTDSIPWIIPIAADDCGIVSLTHRDTILAKGGCPPLAILRVWTANDGCGNRSTKDQLLLQLDTLAPMARCRPVSVSLDDEGRAWLDPDSLDDGSSDDCDALALHAIPDTLTCAERGITPVSLVAVDACGNRDTCQTTVSVSADTAFAFFTAEGMGTGTYDFDATGSSGDAFEWDFGDGQEGTGPNISHTFLSDSTFLVRLIVRDTVCGTTDTFTLEVSGPVSAIEEVPVRELRVIPNPGSGIFRVIGDCMGHERVSVEVFNLLGQSATSILTAVPDHHGGWTLDLSTLPDGAWFLRMPCGMETRVALLLLAR